MQSSIPSIEYIIDIVEKNIDISASQIQAVFFDILVKIAEHMHINSKKIKQHLDITFKDYTTQLKINKAKELLAETDITINELFSMVGFQDRVSFTRTFKQKTGVSPSEYKKNIRSAN